MKIYLLILILIATSCNPNPNFDYSDLIDTWTSEFQADSVLGVQDKMIFKPSDSVIVEVSAKGEQTMMIVGRYSINKKDGTIFIKTDSFERTSKILDLNSKALVLLLPNSNNKWRLRKVH